MTRLCYTDLFKAAEVARGKRPEGRPRGKERQPRAIFIPSLRLGLFSLGGGQRSGVRVVGGRRRVDVDFFGHRDTRPDKGGVRDDGEGPVLWNDFRGKYQYGENEFSTKTSKLRNAFREKYQYGENGFSTKNQHNNQ